MRHRPVDASLISDGGITAREFLERIGRPRGATGARERARHGLCTVSEVDRRMNRRSKSIRIQPSQR